MLFPRTLTPLKGIILFLLLGLFIRSVGLAHAEDALKHGVHVFAGQYTTKSMGDTFNLTGVEYEPNYLLAAAYGQDVLDVGYGFLLGPEIGSACRFGHRWSLEIWGGAVLRYEGVTLFDRLRLSPAMAFGVSMIDKAIGIERNRQNSQDGDARVLFYLGPEIAFSLPGVPQWELVYRLHHRSGGNRTLGNLKGGHNANTFGIRYRF